MIYDQELGKEIQLTRGGEFVRFWHDVRIGEVGSLYDVYGYTHNLGGDIVTVTSKYKQPKRVRTHFVKNALVPFLDHLLANYNYAGLVNLESPVECVNLLLEHNGFSDIDAYTKFEFLANQVEAERWVEGDYRSVRYTGTETGWLSPGKDRIYRCGTFAHLEAAKDICKIHRVVTRRLGNLKYIDAIMHTSPDQFLVEAGWKHIGATE